jgi:transcriptional antiterminator Rof (Rho-off)
MLFQMWLEEAVMQSTVEDMLQCTLYDTLDASCVEHLVLGEKESLKKWSAVSAYVSTDHLRSRHSMLRVAEI